MYSAKAVDRNVFQVVNRNVLSLVGRIAKYKQFASADELKLLDSFMRSVKQLPEDVVKVILLRYFKLASYEPSKDKALAKRPTHCVRDHYKGKFATLKAVSDVLGVSIRQVREWEHEAYDALAPLMLAEKLKGYELYTTIDTQYFRGDELFIHAQIERLKQKHEVIEVIESKKIGTIWVKVTCKVRLDRWVERRETNTQAIQ